MRKRLLFLSLFIGVMWSAQEIKSEFKKEVKVEKKELYLFQLEISFYNIVLL